ncbi:FAD-binding oxidoreductase [Streptomyces sp. RK31]|uniref:FAD-binding oxidoreductase n=1 Tax=Streptomyces sp. RK31 TaxID=2824892 RepID=UPI001B37373C|nr:FAD-binding oxidoreductase [Streptomyces sp. RK31]MBQ0975638.1 FAD-binding oxidoreductase [Streptomyces sp. RK31]
MTVTRRLEKALRPNFRGLLIDARHGDYDAARAVWNAMCDPRPGLIARCADARDVALVVDAARRYGVPLAVRGGGHAVSGRGYVEGCLTADLSRMRRVEVDPRRRIAQAQGGCLLADVDAATEPHGLVVPLGTVSQTGIGGLALGGGIGWLARKYGLTCDNFLELEVVLADGDIVRASQTSHPDLFWALRGGSGNFGVVTLFTLRAHTFGPRIRIGVGLYRPRDAARALRIYGRLAAQLPRAVGWHAVLKRHMPPLPFVPPELAGQRALMLFSMWLEDADDPAGDEITTRLSQVGDPLVSTTLTLPFGTGMQRLMDPEWPDGRRYYTKDARLSVLDGDALETLVAFWHRMPMSGEVQIVCLGGALADVPEDASAFSHRDDAFWVNLSLHWTDPDRDAAHMSLARRTIAGLSPWATAGTYVNTLGVDDEHRVVDAFGGSDRYAQLGRIKAAYDPSNIFGRNANIKPTGDEGGA